MKSKEILVYFSGQKNPVIYTDAILDLLKSDRQTQVICDAQTGEIIFTAETGVKTCAV